MSIKLYFVPIRKNYSFITYLSKPNGINKDVYSTHRESWLIINLFFGLVWFVFTKEVKLELL